MNKKFSNTTDLLALAVLAVFAVCVLMTLLFGVRVYRNLVRRSEDSFERRTAAQYVATRVRQAETVTVTDFEGCEALTIHDQIGGTTYVTRLYCHEGYLRELFCAENAALQPDAGEKILPAEQLELAIENDLLSVRVNGVHVLLQLRGKGVAAP